jgi:hypothetical protein
MNSADETAFAQKYGVTDMSPVRKEKPAEPLITAAEWVEIDARRADVAYIGWPTKPLLHPDPLVCEIAEMILKDIVR